MGHRSSLAFFSAALIGGATVLAVQWLLPHRVNSSPPQAVFASNPIPGPSAPAEPGLRLRINACKDLYSYVCSSRRASDPTGDVRHDSEGEVAVLRIYENLIRTHPQMPMEQIDNLLVNEIYTPTRTKRIRELFVKARDLLLKFIEMPPFQSISAEQLKILKDRIARVNLELPPPSSIYADEPDLITRNDAFYERASDGTIRIRLGGALLFTVKSKFNLAFTLAHELAHSIDPCELKSLNINVPSYTPLIECLGVSQDLEKECSATGELAEIFADWAATHIVAQILTDEQKSYTLNQTKSALFNSVRDLCQDDDDETDFPGEGEANLSSSHPRNEYRVNRIFAQHPSIRAILECGEIVGPMPAGVSLSCFWPMSQQGLSSPLSSQLNNSVEKR